MKLSDEQILDMIWHNQILSTARGPLLKLNEGYGLTGTSQRWFENGVREHRIRRRRVTAEITPAQLLVRIRGLIDKGLVDSDTGSSISFISFHIGTPRAKEAYQFAYSFWVKQGLNASTAKDMGQEQLKRLLRLCMEQLLERYREREVQPIERFGDALSNGLQGEPELLNDLAGKGLVSLNSEDACNGRP